MKKFTKTPFETVLRLATQGFVWRQTASVLQTCCDELLRCGQRVLLMTRISF
jgi:hypothetical protein